MIRSLPQHTVDLLKPKLQGIIISFSFLLVNRDVNFKKIVFLVKVLFGNLFQKICTLNMTWCFFKKKQCFFAEKTHVFLVKNAKQNFY